jgi:hypothetical protein
MALLIDRRYPNTGFIIRLPDGRDCHIAVVEVSHRSLDEPPTVRIAIDGDRDAFEVIRDELLTRDDGDHRRDPRRWMPHEESRD